MKRIFAIIASFLLFFFLFQSKLPVAHAQYYNPYLNPNTESDVPQNMHTYSSSIILNSLASFSCLLSGVDLTTQDHRCLGFNEKTGKIGYVSQDGGALGFMIRAITITYNIPVHTQYYVNYLANSFHVASDRTYAAAPIPNEVGVGAISLNPILQIWIGFRNASYLLVVIIFILIGFLIMFRIKIDPRTVMSIQNQIPKIIIGLLAITFSFAIAGILIDFMYVVTFVLLNIIQGAVKGIMDINPATVAGYSQPFSAANDLLPGGVIGAAAGGADVLHNAFATILGSGGLFGGIINLITLILTTIPNIIIGIICWITGWVGGHDCALGDFQQSMWDAGGITITFIIWITLIISMLTALFRFWVALVTCYITILFNIVLGPVRILFGMIPAGPGGGLTGWLKDLIANLAVFPISLSFMALAGAIARAVSNSGGFTPYLIPGTGIGGIMGFVTILMLPKLPDQVKEWFKVKDGVLGSAVGQGLGAGIGFVGGTGKRLGGTVRNTVFRAPDPYRHIQAGVGWKLLNPTAGVGGPTTKIPVLRQAQQAFNWSRRTAGSFALKQIGINPRSFKDYNDTAGQPISQQTQHKP